jgi:hypothetical protein
MDGRARGQELRNRHRFSMCALCPHPGTTRASGSKGRSRSTWTIASNSPQASRAEAPAACINPSIAGAPIDAARGSAATRKPPLPDRTPRASSAGCDACAGPRPASRAKRASASPRLPCHLTWRSRVRAAASSS